MTAQLLDFPTRRRDPERFYEPPPPDPRDPLAAMLVDCAAAGIAWQMQCILVARAMIAQGWRW